MAYTWTKKKDPSDARFYKVDWSSEIGSDTVSSSTWTAPDGITLETETFDDTTSVIKVSGGTDGTKYTLVNTITTSGGETIQRSFILNVKDL